MIFNDGMPTIPFRDVMLETRQADTVGTVVGMECESRKGVGYKNINPLH